MANLDTPSKRISSLGWGLHPIQAAPLPDGTIGDGDRQHIAVSYSGISAGAPVVVVSTEPDASHFTYQAQSFFTRPSAIDRSSFGFTLVIPPWLRGFRLAGG